MTRIILILTILTITSCKHSQILYPVRQDFLEKKEHERIVKNRIKSITTFMYDYKNDSFEKEGYKNYEEFDNKGNLIMDVMYTPIGNIRSLATYSFNTQGIQTSRKVQNYDKDSSVRFSSETIYNSWGRPIKMLHYVKTELKETNIYTYDRKGRLIKDESVMPNDTVEYFFSYKYNKKNLLIEEISTVSEINDKGKRIYHAGQKYKYKYDKNGNPIEQIICLENNVLLTISSSVYDEKGNLIEDYSYDENDGKLRAKKVFTYDNNGNIIEIKIYSSSGESIYKTTYDENGNPIESISYDKTRPKRKTIYKYDFHKV